MTTLRKLPLSAGLLLLLLTAGITTLSAQKKGNSSSLKDFLTGKGYTAIPLQKYPTGHLYSEVWINGIKGNFIFDTGAGATVVEEKKKDKFRMTTDATTSEATGAGGSGIAMQSSPNNKLSISSYIVNNYTALLMNLDHINNSLKQMGYEEVDGVIGADILTSGQAIIDYPNMVIYLKQ